MVGLDAVRASNATLKNLKPGLVGVFVGGTSGIGETTLRAFVKHTASPKVYIVGRNDEAASKIKADVEVLNDRAHVDFIKTDASLLKNVDIACKEIQAKEDKVNILVLTSGYLTLSGRDETSEGLDRKFALNYYSRMRFVTNLLPQLAAAHDGPNPVSRVVSVLGAGSEGKLIESDLELKTHFSLRNCAAHGITMTSLAFEQLAKTNPGTSFVHSAPGGVETNAAKRMGGITGKLMEWAAKSPFLSPWMVPLGESGERHLYAATAPAFAARGAVVEGRGRGEVGLGVDGVRGSGAYLVGADSEIMGSNKMIQGERERGMVEKVWEHTLGVFRRVDGKTKE